MKAISRLTLFLTLTFVVSYSIAGIYKLIVGDSNDRIGYTILGVIYMFIPTLSVIIIKKVIHHENISKDLLISFKINRWFFVAWLLMPVISFLTIGISLLFPDVSYNPEMLGLIKRYEHLMTPEQLEQLKISLENLPLHPVLLILAQGLLAGITVNALAGFGEELGWRGFLLREFQEMSFLKASIIIGFIWGIWHAPLILMGQNYPQHPIAGVFMMIILSILLSAVFIYITIKSKSVIAAAIMHGTMNATAGISIMLVDGGNDLTVGMAGLAGFIALGILLIGLFIFDSFISKDKILTGKIVNFI